MDTFYRVLLRVVCYDLPKDSVGVIIPGRSASEIVSLKYSQLPLQVQKNICPDFRFHAQSNFGVEKLEDLVVRDFEVE